MDSKTKTIKKIILLSKIQTLIINKKIFIFFKEDIKMVIAKHGEIIELNKDNTEFREELVSQLLK